MSPNAYRAAAARPANATKPMPTFFMSAPPSDASESVASGASELVALASVLDASASVADAVPLLDPSVADAEAEAEPVVEASVAAAELTVPDDVADEPAPPPDVGSGSSIPSDLRS